MVALRGKAPGERGTEERGGFGSGAVRGTGRFVGCGSEERRRFCGGAVQGKGAVFVAGSGGAWRLCVRGRVRESEWGCSGYAGTSGMVSGHSELAFYGQRLLTVIVTLWFRGVTKSVREIQRPLCSRRGDAG